MTTKDSTTELPAEIVGLCAALGITAEELAARLIDRLTDRCLDAELAEWDEAAEEARRPASLMRYVQDRVKAAIDEAVDKIAEQTVAPRVEELIAGTVLQETNKWGEQKGEPVSFVEYIIARAEKWLQEPVAWGGKPKQPGDTYFTAAGPRIAHMIHEHLHHQIEQAMKTVLGDADSQIRKALAETARKKLDELKLTLKLDTGRKG
jgi:hypothetical protein